MSAPGLRLHYIDPSPYARIVRASLIEFGVAHEAVALDYYPPVGVERLSPALQVPVLEIGETRMFGSALIREWVHATHGREVALGLSPELTRAGRHWADAQILTAIETLTDALVVYFHARWAGLDQVGRNRLGGDMIGREMERAVSLLDWLEAEAETPAGFREGGVSAPDLALAAALLWTEAREPIAWAEGRPHLAGIVDAVGERESFRLTAPTPWPRDR